MRTVRTLNSVILCHFLATTCFAAPSGETHAADGATTHGVRMTPAMAEGFARAYLQNELRVDVLMTEQQLDELVQRMSRRNMQLAHEQAEQGRAFFEFLYESMIRTRGRFDADSGKRFAEAADPMIEVFREYLDGIPEDAAPVLDELQLELVNRRVDAKRKQLADFEKRMKRWATGEVNDGERPFDDMKAPIDSSDPKGEQLERVLNARRGVADNVRRIDSSGWPTWVRTTAAFFHFNDEQKNSAEQFLATAMQNAQSVMDEEWRRKVHDNRMRYELIRLAKDLPVQPVLHKLDLEFELLAQPLTKIRRELHQNVLRLITPEQRQSAFAEIQERAGQHGLSPELNVSDQVPLPPATAPEPETKLEEQ